MRTYPIKVPRAPYRGSNPKKLAKAANYSRIAARVEDHINSKLTSASDDTVHVFGSYEIPQSLGDDSQTVHDVVYSIDCGSNGVTIVKGDLDRALAHPRGERSDDTEADA